MRAVSHLLMVLLVVVCSMVSLCTAAPSLEPWHQSINATVFQITKLLSTGTGPAEQMLVSCGAGCYGHQSYVAFAVLDTVSGRLQSSFAHCNAADWYPNTNPICAGRNGEFSLITHLNATGAQVALTSVTQEPECQGTLIQFPPNIAYLYNTPCTAGKMLVFAPIQSQLNGAMTYTYQVDVVAGTVMNVTIPDIAGFTVFSISTDNGGNMDPILVVGMPGSTGIVNLNLFSVTQGLLLSMPYALVDGASPAFVCQDTMAYVVVPVQASPAQLFAIDTVAGRPVWNKTLAAIDAASTWLGPFWSDDCGAVVVNGKAICYSSAGAVVWISQYLGVTTTAAVHPTSGAILVGVTGEGLIALNPFTGSRMWREAPSITLTNITGPLLFVQNNAMAVTQRYLGSGIMELVGVPLNITTPTAAPPTPVPPTTTTTPTPTMP